MANYDSYGNTLSGGMRDYSAAPSPNYPLAPPTPRPGAPDMTALKLYLASTNGYPSSVSPTTGTPTRTPAPAAVAAPTANAYSDPTRAPDGRQYTDTQMGLRRLFGLAPPAMDRGQLDEYGNPPVAASAPAPLTAALSAAKTAASKASGGPSENPGGDFYSSPARGARESDQSNQDWNTHVDQVTQQLSNIGGPAVAAANYQPLPQWNKAAGEAAINAGGGPRLLNYGYGSTIVGQSTNGSKKLNSFTGVGTGAAPAGAAGVFGSPPPQSPYEQVTSHLQDIMGQAAALRANGTLEGAMQARGLENHAARMSSIFSTVAQHAHNMGALGMQQQEFNLRAAQGAPGYELATEKNRLAKTGQWDKLAALNRAEAGKGLAAPMQTVLPMTGQRNEDTNESSWYPGYPTPAR
jgi:hypothetical protein